MPGGVPAPGRQVAVFWRQGFSRTIGMSFTFVDLGAVVDAAGM
ncbi:hypothetical protein [Streptomyces sp. V4I2]|nr:hypothetical protein [Streptomyces sp. V4I2]MDQ1049226.1 hypothetical protein [Streptomyces sp. V4I2]